MADELDAMLEGDDQNNPPASPAENQGSGSNPEDQNSGGQSEEVEFSKLSGDAQDRFRQLWREKQDALAKAQKYESMIGQQQTVIQQPPVAPDVKDAISKLDSVGIATKDYVGKEIQNFLAQKTYYDELDKMEKQLNGSDGKPKFTREEYFDYVDKHPQFKNYLPEDVYGKMFSEELSDWTANHPQSQQTPRRTQALKPTRTGSGQSTELSVDDIEAKLKSLPEPQRSEWYAKNLTKINNAVAQMKG